MAKAIPLRSTFVSGLWIFLRPGVCRAYSVVPHEIKLADLRRKTQEEGKKEKVNTVTCMTVANILAYVICNESIDICTVKGYVCIK